MIKRYDHLNVTVKCQSVTSEQKKDPKNLTLEKIFIRFLIVRGHLDFV